MCIETGAYRYFYDDFSFVAILKMHALHTKDFPPERKSWIVFADFPDVLRSVLQSISKFKSGVIELIKTRKIKREQQRPLDGKPFRWHQRENEANFRLFSRPRSGYGVQHGDFDLYGDAILMDSGHGRFSSALRPQKRDNWVFSSTVRCAPIGSFSAKSRADFEFNFSGVSFDSTEKYIVAYKMYINLNHLIVVLIKLYWKIDLYCRISGVHECHKNHTWFNR